MILGEITILEVLLQSRDDGGDDGDTNKMNIFVLLALCQLLFYILYEHLVSLCHNQLNKARNIILPTL
jgi:hypothetical protein